MTQPGLPANCSPLISPAAIGTRAVSHSSGETAAIFVRVATALTRQLAAAEQLLRVLGQLEDLARGR